MDSKTDFGSLAESVEKNVTRIISLSTDSLHLLNTLMRTGTEIVSAGSVQEAVETANAGSKPGNIVLFSPACPSYHPFDNYRNRGNDFKRAVKTLAEKK